jgi:carbonic anhydrase
METETDALVAFAGTAEFGGPRDVVPSRHTAIVTCMDSRIDTFHIFGIDSGEVHVLRNAGGLVTDDMLRSLVLSQRLLQTREVILVHHTNCGLHNADEGALREQIRAEAGAEPPYTFGAFEDVDDAVRSAIVRVREHPFLPHRNRVRGFVYVVETGELREVIAA